MSEREYSGEPIDVSWQTPPWQNDGETLDAYDSEGDGKIMTDNWPENATDPEELNDKQKKMILTAVNFPDIDSPTELLELSGLDMSKQYPRVVLSRHWPERYWGKPHQSVRDPDESDNTVMNNVTADLKEIRQRALDGESARKIAESEGVSEAPIRKRLTGRRYFSGVECDIPPLEYSREDRCWYIPDDDDPEVQDDIEREASSTAYDEQPERPTPTPPEPTADHTTPRWVWGILLLAAAWIVSKLLK